MNDSQEWWNRPLDEIKRDVVANSLQRHNGDTAQVAKSLGIAQKTVYNLMKKFKLHSLMNEIRNRQSQSEEKQ